MHVKKILLTWKLRSFGSSGLLLARTWFAILLRLQTLGRSKSPGVMCSKRHHQVCVSQACGYPAALHSSPIMNFKDVNFYCTTIQYEYFIYMLERVLKTYTSFLRKAIFKAPLSAGGCAPWNLPSMILLPGTLWLDSWWFWTSLRFSSTWNYPGYSIK